MVKDNSSAESLLEVAQGRGGQGGTERRKGRPSDCRLVNEEEAGMKNRGELCGTQRGMPPLSFGHSTLGGFQQALA